MSVNLLSAWINQENSFFLLANASTINAGNINANQVSTGSLIVDDVDINGAIFVSSIYATGLLQANELSSTTLYTDIGVVSTLFTQHIILDQATLDVVGGNVLLLNGSPIATLGNLSSIADWSIYPAISTVNMGGQNLINGGNITCQNINNALNVQTDTLTVGTSLTAPTAVITNLRTTNLSTLGTATINNLVATTINGGTFAPASNWSQFPATTAVQMAGNNLNGGSNFSVVGSNITFGASNSLSNTCRDFTVVADEGVNLASVANINLTAQNGTYGAVNITANGGFNNAVNGVVNITANGSQVGGVGQGGSINLTANTPLGFSNLTSKISLNASGINSYAGSIPALASAYGYNFIYGQNGVYIASGLPPGLPNVPGTTYIYGTLGIEMPSDAYMKNIYPYWDGLTTPPDLNIEGRYIIPNLAQVCVNLSNVKNLDFQSNVATRITNIDSIQMSNGAITGLNTINGSAYPPPTSGVSVANLTSTVGGLGSIGYISTSQLVSTVAGLGTATIPPDITVSSVRGNNIVISSFSTIYGYTTAVNPGRVIEFDWNPSTGVGAGRAEFSISGKAQNAGAVITNSMGVDLQGGFGYIGTVWDGYISMPLKMEGATIEIASDTETLLYCDGNTTPGTLSTGVSFYHTSTFSATNQNNIQNVRQPFIQYGNITISGGSGSSNVVLPIPYDTVRYNAQATFVDTTSAEISVNQIDNTQFDIYWNGGGGGTHSINWVCFGDLP
jgi:hypothetical protein